MPKELPESRQPFQPGQGARMKRFLKDTLKKVLAKYDFHMVYVSKEKGITGFNFEDDIKLLIPCNEPVCIDVGANDGQTIELLTRIFGNPSIYAFEPSTEMYRRLESKRYGDRIKLIPAGLGEENTEKEFINYDNSVLSSFLPLENHRQHFQQTEIKNKELVTIRSLDTFVQTHNINQIHLLKIDTQGYDLNVLKGAKETLGKGMVDYVFVEINFAKLYAGQPDSWQIHDLLAEHGYQLVDYYEKVHHDGVLSWCTGLFAGKKKQS